MSSLIPEPVRSEDLSDLPDMSRRRGERGGQGSVKALATGRADGTRSACRMLALPAAAFVALTLLYHSNAATQAISPARTLLPVIEEDWGPGNAPSRRRGNHASYMWVVRVGDKFAAVVNGRRGPPYDQIDRIDGSADGSRWAYWARKEQKWMVVVADGAEGKEYDYTPEQPWASVGDETSQPAFSADGRRLAYAARKGDGYVVVVDGRESPEYRYVTRPQFSPDGKHVAYLATRSGSKLHVGSSYPLGMGFVVLDGKEGPTYERVYNVTFSPDGARHAYAVQKDGRFLIVANGKESRPYDSVGMPASGNTGWAVLQFSPNGSRLAYIAMRNGRWFVVLDGREGAGFDRICSVGSCNGVLVFSPDSKRFAHVAGSGGKSFVVLDGKKQPEYDKPAPESLEGVDSLTFSPNSRRFAYWAHKGAKWLVVVDGREGPEYSGKLDLERWTHRPPVFSPDSRRVAYAALKGGAGESTAIENERERTATSTSWNWGVPGATVVVVVDGVEGTEFSQFFHSYPLFDAGSRHVAYLGMHYGKVHAVLDGQLGAAHEGISAIAFSTDGRHFAYVAHDSGRDALVVDGMAGPAYSLIDQRSVSYTPPRAAAPNGRFEFVAVRADTVYRVLQPLPGAP